MNTGHSSLTATAIHVYRHFQRSAVTTLAAAVAYHTLFSFVPLLLFLTAMVGVVSRAVGIDSVMSTLTDWLYHRSGLPPAVADTLRGPIESIISTTSGTALGAGALLALWGAQNGIRAMMRALNVAYDVEEGRNWFVKTAVAVGLTVAVGLGNVLVAILVLAGGSIGSTVADWLHLSREFRALWGAVRWVAAPVMVAGGLALLYWAGPNRKGKIQWITPGAVIAVLLFGAATWGLGIYFTYAGSYVTAYGVLGAVMGFVFWLYVMAIIALLGACINAVLDRQRGIVSEPRVAPKPGAAWIGVPLPQTDPGSLWSNAPANADHPAAGPVPAALPAPLDPSGPAAATTAHPGRRGLRAVGIAALVTGALLTGAGTLIRRIGGKRS